MFVGVFLLTKGGGKSEPENEGEAEVTMTENPTFDTKEAYDPDIPQKKLNMDTLRFTSEFYHVDTSACQSRSC